MKLFGTTTSPYVRRVRIVASTLGQDYDLINTADESGQSQLRAVSPLWKVPTMMSDDMALWDSHTIIDWMFEKYGYGNLRQPNTANKWQGINIMNATDAALDSGINLFYLKKDGLDTDAGSYLEKQSLRVQAILEWLTNQLEDPCLKVGEKYSYPAVVLVSTIDWLSFRRPDDLVNFSPLVEFAQSMNQHKIIHETYPC